MKTRNYCLLIIEKYDLNGAYALAKLMGCTTQAASNWLKGKTAFSEQHAKKAAELLELDEKIVMMDRDAETAPTPEVKKVYQDIAQMLRSAAAVLLIALGITSPTEEVSAAQVNKAELNITNIIAAESQPRIEIIRSWMKGAAAFVAELLGLPILMRGAF